MHILPTDAPCVNVSSYLSLSAPLASFYRWLYKWHQQTGEVYASTRYLAKKQKRTERTIYRRLCHLAASGLIQREVDEGEERRIIPLLDLPPEILSPSRKTRRSCRKASGVNVRGELPETSGVFPYRDALGYTQVTTNTEPKAQSTTNRKPASVVVVNVKKREYPLPVVKETPPAQPVVLPLPEVVNPLVELHLSASFLRRHLDKLQTKARIDELLAAYRAKGNGLGYLIDAIKNDWTFPEYRVNSATGSHRSHAETPQEVREPIRACAGYTQFTAPPVIAPVAVPADTNPIENLRAFMQSKSVFAR